LANRFIALDNSRTLRTRPFRHPAIAFLIALTFFATWAQSVTQQAERRLFAVIGIATEIAPVEARLMGATINRIQGIVFTFGTIDGTRIVAVRSGVGKVSAAMAATLLLDHHAPSAVVFSGTAGAVDVDLEPGDVVIGTGVGYHDYGNVTVDGLVRTPTRDYASGRIDPAFFPAGADLLAAARKAAETMKAMRIRQGLIVTGDAFMSNPAHRTELRRALNAVAVEMEGAAVAQVCMRFGVPAIVIRGITDRADGNASQSYTKFRDTAARNAANLAVATIREFAK
jgi:adenosylhomocysteine nucleosidase